jgi:hypothetical protein
VPQTNLDELISKTEELILHPALRASFGNKSHEHVIQHWDMRMMAKKLKKIYNRKKG